VDSPGRSDPLPPRARTPRHNSLRSISGDPQALARAAEILAAKYAPGRASGAAPGLTATEYAHLLVALARLLVRHRQDSKGRRLAARSLAAPPWPPRRIAVGVLISLAPGLYRRITRPFLPRTAGSARPLDS